MTVYIYGHNLHECCTGRQYSASTKNVVRRETSVQSIYMPTNIVYSFTSAQSSVSVMSDMSDATALSRQLCLTQMHNVWVSTAQLSLKISLSRPNSTESSCTYISLSSTCIKFS